MKRIFFYIYFNFHFIQTIQQQQQTIAPTKNLHVSTTTAATTMPNVIQPQQRSGTSAHVRLNHFFRIPITFTFQITITAAQLQQILNASQKTTSPATKVVQQIDNDNQSSDETTAVDIKQQPV